MGQHGKNAERGAQSERQSHEGHTSEGAGKLYVVATPIGNLGDISARALAVLTQADLVAAEDTRTTGHLLAHHGIAAKLVALHEHNEMRRAAELVARMKAGVTIALVSDAGTPGISDPGALLVAQAREAGVSVCPIPGANAAIAALSAAGLAAPHFLFYGFLPVRPAARRTALEALRELPYALVFYEAPHRVSECVADLAAILGGGRDIVIARELTKLFEAIHRCRLDRGRRLARGRRQPAARRVRADRLRRAGRGAGRFAGGGRAGAGSAVGGTAAQAVGRARRRDHRRAQERAVRARACPARCRGRKRR